MSADAWRRRAERLERKRYEIAKRACDLHRKITRFRPFKELLSEVRAAELA